MPRIVCKIIMDLVQISWCSERILIYRMHRKINLQLVTTSELVANMNAIHAARKAFVETEASEKLRRAILRKVRPPTSLNFSRYISTGEIRIDGEVLVK